MVLLQNHKKGRFSKAAPLPLGLLLGALLAVMALALVVSLFLPEKPGDGTGQTQTPENQGAVLQDPTVQPTLGTDPTAPQGTTEPTDGSEATQPTETQPADPTDPTKPADPTKPNGSPTQPSQSETPPAVKDPEPEVEVEAVQITCDEYSLFDGQYPEDGKDELVANVAAILVTNRSDRFLDLATIYFTIDGRPATFIVTGLPAGRSAWVMEASRLTAANDSVFLYRDIVTGFRDPVVTTTDKLTVTADGNMLKATNNTDKPMKEVFVIYKVRHTDGNFFGGIAYRTDFGTLEPGASVELLAGHYGANAEIVRIGWLEE